MFNHAPEIAAKESSTHPETAVSHSRLRRIASRWKIKKVSIPSTASWIVEKPGCEERSYVRPYNLSHRDFGTDDLVMTGRPFSTTEGNATRSRAVTPFYRSKVVEYYAPGGEVQKQVRVPEGPLYG